MRIEGALRDAFSRAQRVLIAVDTELLAARVQGDLTALDWLATRRSLALARLEESKRAALASA